jgi:hypothetical protein
VPAESSSHRRKEVGVVSQRLFQITEQQGLPYLQTTFQRNIPDCEWRYTDTAVAALNFDKIVRAGNK